MFPTLRMRRRESNILSMGYHSPTKIELSLINPMHWRTPFIRPNVVTISIRISMGLPKIVKGRTRVDSRRKGASTKKKFHLKVGINQHRLTRERIKEPKKGPLKC
jgi:hypothetical protein